MLTFCQQTARKGYRHFFYGGASDVPGELARVTGLPRPDAGLGNRALVAEGVATSPARGVYILAGTPVPAPAPLLT